MSDNLKVGLLVLVLILIGFGLWYFQMVVFYLLISAVLSLVLRPFFELLNGKYIASLHCNKTISALITVIIVLVIAGGFVSFIIPFFINEIQYLSAVDVLAVVDRLDEFTRSFISPFESTPNVPMLKFQLNEFLVSIFDLSRLQLFLSSLFDVFGGFAIGLFSITFITFFLLKDEWIVLETFKTVVHKHHYPKVEHIISSINILLQRYFIGVLIQISLITILITCGMMLIGLSFNHAIIIGLFAGILNIIPYLGPLIGAAFGLLLSLIISLQQGVLIEGGWYFWGVIFTFLIVQTLDNLLFQPLIFSSSVKAHPLEIFIVIIMAGYTAGMLGMFLAIPVYTIIRVVAKEFFSKYQLVRKLTGRLD